MKLTQACASRWPLEPPTNFRRERPDGHCTFLLHWETAACSLLSRLRREAVGPVGNTQLLLAELMAYPNVPQDRRPSSESPALPMITLSFRTEGHTIDLFSMITTVGTPQTVSAEEMRIETMFPADEASEVVYLDFMARRDGSQS